MANEPRVALAHDYLMSAGGAIFGLDFAPQAIRQHALQFDVSVFNQKMVDFVALAYSEYTALRSKASQPKRTNDVVEE